MSATVNVVCYRNKKLANGESPLMLRVSKDRKTKYKSLSISIDPRYWDFDKNRPKSNCPNKDYIIKIIIDKEAEIEFVNVFNVLNIEYQMLIADSMFFIDILKNLPDDNIKEYISYHIDESIKNDDLLGCIGNVTTISHIIKCKGDYSNIKENSDDIINQRIVDSIDKITSNLEILKIAICSLVKERLDKIDLSVYNI